MTTDNRHTYAASWDRYQDAWADIAPAERLLFMTPHLRGVAAQTELDYAMTLSHPPEKASDTVRVLVKSANNAGDELCAGGRWSACGAVGGGEEVFEVVLHGQSLTPALSQWESGQESSVHPVLELLLKHLTRSIQADVDGG